MLSFIEGEVPHEMPEWIWSDAVLRDVGRALRQWHDATMDFAGVETTWRLAAREPLQVVCHNDFAPYNCVFQDGRLVGAIDFDCCAPGPRIWDVAYTAYRFVPLMPDKRPTQLGATDETSPFDRVVMAQRLEVLLDAYAVKGGGRFDLAEVLAVTSERLEALAGWTETQATASANSDLERHAVMYRQHAHWLRLWTAAG